MPNGSRAQNSSRLRRSQMANAYMPRSWRTTSLPSQAYISSSTSAADLVRSRTPRAVQPLGQFHVVVDLAVEDHHEPAVRGLHRLAASLARCR